jgi:hypothetical protein
MRTPILFFFLSCAPPGPAPAAQPVLPELRLPPDTLILREHIGARGPERTGNWWARIDKQGCYTEAHNSWMWVSDSVLRRSTAWTLHWNASPSLEPWFCLTGAQLKRLTAAARQSRPTGSQPEYLGAIDRWSVVLDGELMTLITPASGSVHGFQPLLTAIEQIAEQGVWGLSPESEADTGSPPTAFIP